MTSNCEEMKSEQMDSFSIENYRRDSSHCFYQNRGKNYLLSLNEVSLINFFSSSLHPIVIQPLLTGEFLTNFLNLSVMYLSFSPSFCLYILHFFSTVDTLKIFITLRDNNDNHYR